MYVRRYSTPASSGEKPDRGKDAGKPYRRVDKATSKLYTLYSVHTYSVPSPHLLEIPRRTLYKYAVYPRFRQITAVHEPANQTVNLTLVPTFR
jgi:hypothetical protein